MKKSKSIAVLFAAALTLTACEDDTESEYAATTACDQGGDWDGDDCYDGRDSTDASGNQYRHSYFGYWYIANRSAGTVTRYYPHRGIGKKPYSETVTADLHRSGSHLSSPSHLQYGGKTSFSPSGGFGATGSKSYGGSTHSSSSSSGGSHSGGFSSGG